MRKDIHKGKTRQMPSVRSADHNGVPAKVRGQAERFTRFFIFRILHDARQIFNHKSDACTGDLFDFAIERFTNGAI